MIEQIKNDVHKVLETAIQIAVNINELKIDKIPKIIFSPTKAPEHGDIASPKRFIYVGISLVILNMDKTKKYL